MLAPSSSAPKCRFVQLFVGFWFARAASCRRDINRKAMKWRTISSSDSLHNSARLHDDSRSLRPNIATKFARIRNFGGIFKKCARLSASIRSHVSVFGLYATRSFCTCSEQRLLVEDARRGRFLL